MIGFKYPNYDTKTSGECSLGKLSVKDIELGLTRNVFKLFSIKR